MALEYHPHEYVDPAAGESPRQRQAREQARREAHGDIAQRFAMGNDYEKAHPASEETRRARMAEITADFNKKKALKNIPELSLDLAGRANALLNIMDFMNIRNQAERIAARSTPDKKVMPPKRIQEAYIAQRPHYEEGLDYLFPEATDPDGSQRAQLEEELGGHGDEAREKRREYAQQLRAQAAIMGFRVSPPPSK